MPKASKTSWRRSVLLVLAITLHNIPEGLAVGVAFGALAADIPTATLAGAVALALGMRHPELSGRCGRLRSPAPGRLFASQKFLVRSGLRRGGADRRRDRGVGRRLYAAYSTLCIGLCRRAP